MKMPKEEIVEELNHQQNMLRLLRQRRRERERQAAQYGLDAPPHVVNEINALSEQIREREAEITRLETLSAEEDLSLAEAEYRVLLAEGLDKSSGSLAFVDIARLELARLRLRLAHDRAQQLEEEVRQKLCSETVLNISNDFRSTFYAWLSRSKERQKFMRSDVDYIIRKTEEAKAKIYEVTKLEKEALAFKGEVPKLLTDRIAEGVNKIKKILKVINVNWESIETIETSDMALNFLSTIDSSTEAQVLQDVIDPELVALDIFEGMGNDIHHIRRALQLDKDTLVHQLYVIMPDLSEGDLEILLKATQYSSDRRDREEMHRRNIMGQNKRIQIDKDEEW